MQKNGTLSILLLNEATVLKHSHPFNQDHSTGERSSLAHKNQKKKEEKECQQSMKSSPVKHFYSLKDQFSPYRFCLIWK